jgi:hypothetical protein
MYATAYSNSAARRQCSRTIYGGYAASRIRVSYRPARLLRLAESLPWNQFLGSLKVYKYHLRTELGCADQQYRELHGSAYDTEAFLALAFMPNKITRNCQLIGAVWRIFLEL